MDEMEIFYTSGPPGVVLHKNRWLFLFQFRHELTSEQIEMNKVILEYF